MSLLEYSTGYNAPYSDDGDLVEYQNDEFGENNSGEGPYFHH